MIRAVFKKELKVLWSSPLPYVLGAVFHATLGTLAWGQLGDRGQAVFQPIVPVCGYLLILIAPVLTSRVWSDEIRSGTLDLLLAARVRVGALAVGKYLAAVVSLLIILAPAMGFAGLLTLWGDPDHGPIITGAIGLVLLAAALCGIGVLMSSLTASQPVAAISGLFAVQVLWFAHTGSEALAAGDVLGAFSISERLRSFAGGLIDGSDAAFFVALAIVAVAASRIAIVSRRYR